MAHPPGIVQEIATTESVLTLEWRNLRLHVVTREPLSADQLQMIERALPKVASVGLFADLLAMMFGRSVRIVTERPSPEIRLEVGLQ